LTKADLTGADLRSSKCQKADFRGALLSNVNLTGANLTEAKFDKKIEKWLIKNGYFTEGDQEIV
jgi:uncharacterized protein YjbI with pentapeptide repeats